MLRATASTVSGGLVLLPPPPSQHLRNIFVNVAPIVVVGQRVQSHGPSPHNTATMAQGSPNVFAYGLPVCREGDLASCGDPASNGSTNVFVN